jgi:hypothetical protein
MKNRQSEAIRGLHDVIKQGQGAAADIAARTRLTARDTAPYTLSPQAEALLTEAVPQTTSP